MIAQKTYDFEGVTLVKKTHLDNTFKCEFCFFKEKNCSTFINEIASCFKGADNNKERVIFIEAKEELVNKIES